MRSLLAKGLHAIIADMSMHGAGYATAFLHGFTLTWLQKVGYMYAQIAVSERTSDS